MATSFVIHFFKIFFKNQNVFVSLYVFFFSNRNLLYPFIDASLFEDNVEKINNVLKQTKPFEIEFRDFGENFSLFILFSNVFVSFLSKIIT